MHGVDGAAYGVSFDKKRSALVTAGWKVAQEWRLDALGTLRANAKWIACQRLGGGLSPAEWETYVSTMRPETVC
jgi:hypothetical protein